MALMLALLASVVAPAPAKEQSTGNATLAPQPVVLPGAVQFDIDSHHTGRRYRIFVSEPQQRVESGHPVVYLLDGNAQFPTAHTLARSAARVAQRREPGAAAPIVVAIGYPLDGLFDDQARAEDYTPPLPIKDPAKDGKVVKQGGADRFLAFMQQELKPLIESRYPIDAGNQTLAGHSYGGLFALHVLFTHGEAFQRYVASSPSIWWNQRAVLSERPRLQGKATAARLLITVGSLEQPPSASGTDQGRGAMLAERRMVDNARDLAASLNAEPANGVPTRFLLLDGENHHSAAFPMLIRAIEFAQQP